MTDGTPPPDTPDPDTAVPGGAAQGSAGPDETAPDATAPDGAAPGNAAPDAAALDAAALDAAALDATAPDGAAPDATGPGSVAPDATPDRTPPGVTGQGDSALGVTGPDGTLAAAAAPDATPAAAAPDGTPPEGAAPGNAAAGSAAPDGAGPGTAAPWSAEPGGERRDGWPLRRITGVAVAVIGLFAVLAVTVGALALLALSNARATVLSKLDPASLRALRPAIAELNSASAVLDTVCAIAGAVLVVIAVALAFGLRRVAVAPLGRLAAEARQVADGDFGHEVGRSGPREIRELGADVNRMRERILRELSAVRAANAELELRTRDLQRSNSELEQFAYVASHDLQEPLRKVASFCQLLQSRYAGRLDERADQYIELAVDGATRMQTLINDLLSFGRVGQGPLDAVPVACATALDRARANLSSEFEATGAVIEIGPLPVVMGEESLLTAVFQNLLSNALKFRGADPPRIRVSARRDGECWLFSVQDNGIGVEPEFADRIFVIFQRLHSRGDFPGTGIGLAMCRKIIEYHGGRIWLDTSVSPGCRFCFTLAWSAVDGSPDD